MWRECNEKKKEKEKKKPGAEKMRWRYRIFKVEQKGRQGKLVNCPSLPRDLWRRWSFTVAWGAVATYRMLWVQEDYSSLDSRGQSGAEKISSTFWQKLEEERRLCKITSIARKNRVCLCSKKTLIKASIISDVVYGTDNAWNQMADHVSNKVESIWNFPSLSLFLKGILFQWS